MEKKHLVLFGASSAVAMAVARIYAKEGASFTLIGRQHEKLESCQKDLLVRGASQAKICLADFSDPKLDESLIKQIEFPVHILIVAHGVLGEQNQLLSDTASRMRLTQINFISVVEILSRLIEPFSRQGFGTIAVVSSVAGDRGRQSNFYYGASKAALTAFCSGLRSALFKKGVHVMTVLPGFIASPMTAHLPQGPLFVSPQKIAKDIVRGIERRRNVLYTPFFWRYIMLIIKLIPEAIFKRLSL